MVVFERVGLIPEKSLGSRRGLLIKFLSNFPMLMMIGCLTQNLKMKEVLAHQTRSQLVESVVKNIMVVA